MILADELLAGWSRHPRPLTSRVQRRLVDYTNDPSTNQHPNQHDYDELVTIYSHLDSTTTVAQASTKQQPRIGNDEASWGHRVDGSRAEGHAVYVRDFGGGDSVVTFVTWA